MQKRKTFGFELRFDKTQSSIAKAGTFSLLVRVNQGLSAFIINVLIGRIGGPSLLGSVQTVISTAAIGSLFFAAPISGALSRNLAIMKSSNEYEEMAGLSRFIAIRIMVTSIFVTLIVSSFAIYFFGIPLETIAVMATFIFILSFKPYFDSLHFGIGDTKRLAYLSSLVAIVSVLGVLLLLASNFTSIWILLPLIFSNFLYFVLSRPPRTKTKIPKSLKRQIYSFVFLEAIGTLGSSGFQQLIVLVAAATLGLTYTGNLSVAITLVAPILIATGAFSSVLFPALGVSHHQKDFVGLASRVDISTRAISLFVVAATILLIMISPFLVTLLWGSSYDFAVSLVQVLAINACIYSVAAPSVAFVTSKSNKGMRFAAISSVGGACLGALSLIILIEEHPEIAIPTSLFISTVSSATILYVHAWIKLKQRWGAQTILVFLFVSGAIIFSFISSLFSLNWIQICFISVSWIALFFLFRYKDLRILSALIKKSLGA
jgi:O-antigen/teichoic acid export membrane protein